MLGKETELVFLGNAGGVAQYAARVDESHVSISANTTTNVWTVHDKGGRTYTFGTNSDGSAPNAARTGPNTGAFNTTFAWHLTQIADGSGNTLDVAYAQFDGYAYPKTISYGGNPALVPLVTNQFTVEVALRTWSPARVSWAAGFERKAAHLPDTISVKFAGALVRSYVLTWQAGVNGQPLLQSFQLKGSDGSLLSKDDGTGAATTFVYAGSTPSSTMHQETKAPLFTEFNDADDCATWKFADLNGDGLPDLIHATSSNWTVFMNHGPSAAAMYTTGVTWTAPSACITTRALSRTLTKASIIDLDGDGRLDYVDASTLPWRLYRNTGSGFSTTFTSWTAGAPNLLVMDVNNNVSQNLIDFDGDGLPDLVRSNNSTTWFVQFNTGSGFGSPVSVTAPTPYCQTGASTDPGRNIDSDLFDMNGDGLPDMVVAKGNTSYPSCTVGIPAGHTCWHWEVSYGTGTGFSPVAYWPSPPQPRLRSWNDTGNYFEYDVFDIDGDRLPDFVDASSYASPGNPNWKVYRNKITAFGAFDTWPAATNLRKKSASATSALTTDTLDVDGNGYPDSVQVSGGLLQCWYQHPTGGRPDALVQMTNPLGGTTNLTYAVSTGFNDVNVATSVYDGKVHLPFPVWAVASTTRHDDSAAGGGPVTTTYRYGGGYFDPVRRELAGFHTVTAVDDFLKYDVRQYEQRDVLRGKLLQADTYGHDPGSDGGAGGLKETVTTWSCDGTNTTCATPDLGSRYFPRITRTDWYDYESDRDTPWRDTGASRSGATVYGNGVSVPGYDACGNIIDERTLDPSLGYTIERTADFAQPYNGCDANRVCATGFCDQPKSTAVAGGVQRTFTYFGSGLMQTSTFIGAGDPTTQYTYFPNGAVESMTEPWGRSTLPKTRVTSYSYDIATRLYPITVIRDDGVGAHLRLTSHATWDPKFGKMLTSTDPAGGITSWAYDVFGRLQSVTEPGMTQPARSYAYVLQHLHGAAFDAFRRDTTVYEPNRAGGSYYLKQS